MLLEGKKPVEAKRVGAALVAAFRAAQPRLVWRFDLEKNHSFSVALEGEEGAWELGVTSPKGEFYPVARFPDREDADEAFAALQRALMKGKSGFLGAMLKGLGFLALVFVLALVMTGFAVSRLGLLNAAATPAAAAVQLPPRPGMPLPADQVLRPPP